MLATVTGVANCFLVEMISHASPGTTLLKATLDRDRSATPFHRECFVAYTTGALHDNVRIYCIVTAPGS